MYVLVSPCSPNPCQNDGSCSVDINYEATCACNGEWSGFYCSGKFVIFLACTVCWTSSIFVKFCLCTNALFA
jgi:hypothetical protein